MNNQVLTTISSYCDIKQVGAGLPSLKSILQIPYISHQPVYPDGGSQMLIRNNTIIINGKISYIKDVILTKMYLFSK